jgi:hypothetical protein
MTLIHKMEQDLGEWPEQNEEGVLEILSRVKTDLTLLNSKYKKFSPKQILNIVSSTGRRGSHPIISGNGKGIDYEINFAAAKHFLNNYHYASHGCANCVYRAIINRENERLKQYCSVDEHEGKEGVSFDPSGISTKLRENNYGKGCEQRKIQEGLRSVEDMFKE